MDERASRESDIEAFFDQPRSRLYGGAGLVLATGLAALAGLWQLSLSDLSGLWVGPIGIAPIPILVAVLRRSPAGRGAIWVFSGKWGVAPRGIFVIWVVFTVLLTTVVAWLEVAASS